MLIEINDALSEQSQSADLRRLDRATDRLQATYLIRVPNDHALAALMNKLKPRYLLVNSALWNRITPWAVNDRGYDENRLESNQFAPQGLSRLALSWYPVLAWDCTWVAWGFWRSCGISLRPQAVPCKQNSRSPDSPHRS